MCLHDITDSDLRNGFPKMNTRLGILNEQFLNILWGGWQLSARQAFNKNHGVLWAQLHTTLNAPEPVHRFENIERGNLHKRLNTKANTKECEKVKLLDPEDFVEDGHAAVALCRYVKAIYEYMHVTL
jgi:predicted alpha-1,6-mannanase (GH76 family)